MKDNGLNRDGGAPPRPRQQGDLGMQKEYMKHILEAAVGKVVTVDITTVDPHDDKELIYQVLEVDKKHVVASGTTGAPPLLGLPVAVQPLQRWNGGDAAAPASMAATLTVYPLEDPCLVDAMAILGKLSNGFPGFRSVARAWQERVSEVEACAELHSSSPLVPIVSLTDASIPVISLVEGLQQRGWVPHRGVVCHTISDPGPFDVRNMSSRRLYMQVLISAELIFAAGVEEIRSDGSQAYYRLLLRHPDRCPAAGLAAQVYADVLRECEENEVEELELEELEPPPPPPVSPVNGDEADDGIAVAPLDAAVDPPQPPTPPLPEGEHSEAEEGSAAGPGDDPAPATPPAVAPPLEDDGGDDDAYMAHAAEAGPAWNPEEGPLKPATIGGQPVFETLSVKRNGTIEHRWRIWCRNPAHGDCSISRTVMGQDAEVAGPRSCEAFLSMWIERSEEYRTKARHKEFRPRLAAIRQWIQEHAA